MARPIMNSVDPSPETRDLTGKGPADRPGAVSLAGMHRSVAVPHLKAGFWRQLAAYFGPGALVSVAYMDPGNWGTDLQAGGEFKYRLLWVVALASGMAMFLQMIAARLGVATGRDLAQCCHDWYPRWTRFPNWVMAEVAIIACDMAEVLGGAVALLMLFHIPIFWGVIVTGADVLLLLAMQRFGMRTIEAVVMLLVATIGVCYFVEIFVLPQTQPGFLEMGRALFTPQLGSTTMTYVAIGIIGATVMPHVLYLPPALVQSRQFQKDDASIRNAIRFNAIDVVSNLSVAFFVNAAILVLAAIVFYGKTSITVPGRPGCPVQRQHRLDSSGLPDAGAAAGNGGGGHAVRCRAAGQRSKCHDCGNHGGPGGHGRFHALENCALAAPDDHALPGDHPHGHFHRHPRGRKRERFAGAEPGDIGPAVAVRHVSTASLCQFPATDGEMAAGLGVVNPRLGFSRGNYRL